MKKTCEKQCFAHKPLQDAQKCLQDLSWRLQATLKTPQNVPRYPQDGINLAQGAHSTAYNIQRASHIPGPAECAVAIE